MSERINSDVGQHTDLFPTETEIYLLPNGEIVVADMPAELAERLKKIGLVPTTESVNLNVISGEETISR